MNSILILIGALALGSSPATAQNITVIGDVPTARVSYADLNLQSESRRARLQQRIRGAAANLCLESNIDSLETRVARRTCFFTAVNDGYQQLDELVTARVSGTAAAAAAITISAR
jgi:UrcA family protein